LKEKKGEKFVIEKEYKPLLGITIGDPSGIGPEIVLKALQEKQIYDICRPLVIGERKVLERAAEAIHMTDPMIRIISDPSEGAYQYGTIELIETGDYDISQLEWGKEQKLAGQIAIDAIYKSISLGMEGKIDAVTTAPINKVAIKMAGVMQEGHTEIYRDLTGAPFVLTMFDCFKMRVFHLSRHMSLRNAIDYVTEEHVLNDVIRINQELEKAGIEKPLIAVAGLNPHCGEGGLFGDEEIKEINPAIARAKEMGIRAVGPISPDTLFARGKAGEFDAILALFHDQGHIPCKTLDLEESVSITLGLPFVRGSVDHGTAFDKAGKGIATNKSMVAAIRSTVKYASAMHQTEE